MDTGFVIVVAVAVVGVALIVFLLTRTKHPDETASHEDERPDTTNERFYRGVDRPAGPDAEDPPAP
jgi:hypothetical protein